MFDVTRGVVAYFAFAKHTLIFCIRLDCVLYISVTVFVLLRRIFGVRLVRGEPSFFIVGQNFWAI